MPPSHCQPRILQQLKVVVAGIDTDAAVAADSQIRHQKVRSELLRRIAREGEATARDLDGGAEAFP